MAKQKVWEFPASVQLKDKTGKVVLQVLTQLYKACGMYVAEYWSGDAIPNQFGLKPEHMAKYMKQFEQDNLKDGAVSEFGTPIKVTTDPDGFYVRAE
jgi:hypothetical protein